MPIQYGEMFERLGVNGMGRQGSGWCGINPSGVLVLMAHQNFFHRDANGNWYYDAPGDPRLPAISQSAARSIRMIAEYSARAKEILLPVGIFRTDGRIHANGAHEPADFQEATGRVYKATIRSFDATTGSIVCDVTSYIETQPIGAERPRV